MDTEALILSLPSQVPQEWMTKSEAEKLGYRLRLFGKKALKIIDTNQSMFNFSTSNISNELFYNLLGLRLEGFILRIRITLYTILIVVLTPFPLACLLLIFILELTHLAMTAYYVLRYRYVKNWFITASKINIGVSILAVTFLGLTILLLTENPSSFQNSVSTGL